MKNCDLGLENAALGLRPRAAFSRPRSQFFTIRTSQPANNIYILNGRQILNKNGGEACCGSLALCSHYADTRYTVLKLIIDRYWGDYRNQKSEEIRGSSQSSSHKHRISRTEFVLGSFCLSYIAQTWSILGTD